VGTWVLPQRFHRGIQNPTNLRGDLGELLGVVHDLGVLTQFFKALPTPLKSKTMALSMRTSRTLAYS
jgi:hypothetical protein